jgi:SulP family sulfate permease
MTNITNGGRTPVAGIIHTVVLLLIFLFLMPLINEIPMACLAAVLIVVAYNMSAWRTVVGIFKSPKGDVSVLIVTFLLTVIFDLTIAIEIGLLLAVVLFLRRVTENTEIRVYGEQLDISAGTESAPEVLDLAPGISVYEIDGPFFFGVATKFDEMMRITMGDRPLVRIIRMRKVPFIDSTAIHNLELLIKSSQEEGIQVVLSGVNPSVSDALRHAKVDKLIGERNICDHITKAVALANSLVAAKA